MWNLLISYLKLYNTFLASINTYKDIVKKNIRMIIYDLLRLQLFCVSNF